MRVLGVNLGTSLELTSDLDAHQTMSCEVRLKYPIVYDSFGRDMGDSLEFLQNGDSLFFSGNHVF